MEQCTVVNSCTCYCGTRPVCSTYIHGVCCVCSIPSLPLFSRSHQSCIQLMRSSTVYSILQWMHDDAPCTYLLIELVWVDCAKDSVPVWTQISYMQILWRYTKCIYYINSNSDDITMLQHWWLYDVHLSANYILWMLCAAHIHKWGIYSFSGFSWDVSSVQLWCLDFQLRSSSLEYAGSYRLEYPWSPSRTVCIINWCSLQNVLFM